MSEKEAREEHQRRWRAERSKKLERIRKGGPGKKGYVFHKLDDRLFAAKANGSLLRRAQTEANISREQVVEKFAKINRYMVQPDSELQSPKAREKAKRNLQGPVRKYLELARQIAQLAQFDELDAQICVVEKTSLWDRLDDSDSDDDPRPRKLQHELEEMALYVIRKTALERLFRRARRIPGVWDPIQETFVPPKPVRFSIPDLRPQTCFFDLVCRGWFEHWEEAPALPAIPLLSFLHAKVPARFRIEKHGHAVRQPAFANLEPQESNDPSDGDVLFWREIRLCLGPATDPEQIRPMFETRVHFEIAIRANDAGLDTHALWPGRELYFRGISNQQIQRSGNWHRVAIELLRGDPTDEEYDQLQKRRASTHPLYWSFAPLDGEADLCAEHYYVSWTPLSADYVALWLDRKRDFVLPVHGSAPIRPPRRETWYAEPSAAHKIEEALANGQLETGLIDAVDRLRKALETREAEWQSNAGLGDLVSYWRNSPDQQQ